MAPATQPRTTRAKPPHAAKRQIASSAGRSATRPSFTVKVLHEAHIGEVNGFHAVGVHCGIKKRKKDLALLFSDRPASAAGVFTTNAVVAAPVTVSRAVVASGTARAIVVNSGNANAVTGEQGLADAYRMQELAAEALGIPPGQVLVSSTGVIGHLMPMEKVAAGIADAAKLVAGWTPDPSAAEAIMTTDTVPKEIVVEVSGPWGSFRVGAVAKGSGMIAPNMATMLGFVATDVAVDAETLLGALAASVDATYNMISVDHDTSTNDMVLALANGASGLTVGKKVPLAAFQAALHQVNLHLAKAIARDGEGATKLVSVTVTGAASETDAKAAAKAVVDSPLVKTAIHGEDPNWGRILAAVGYSGAQMELHKVSLSLGNAKRRLDLLAGGEPLAFSKADGRKLLGSDEIVIHVELGLGLHSATAWGCDLSREYVDINAHYTT